MLLLLIPIDKVFKYCRNMEILLHLACGLKFTSKIRRKTAILHGMVEICTQFHTYFYVMKMFSCYYTTHSLPENIVSSWHPQMKTPKITESWKPNIESEIQDVKHLHILTENTHSLELPY